LAAPLTVAAGETENTWLEVKKLERGTGLEPATAYLEGSSLIIRRYFLVDTTTPSCRDGQVEMNDQREYIFAPFR
jgi:hypothetical protein